MTISMTRQMATKTTTLWRAKASRPRLPAWAGLPWEVVRYLGGIAGANCLCALA
jgi:hypothetical protein